MEILKRKGSLSSVIWLSSSAAEIYGPQGGVDMEALRSGKEGKSGWKVYDESKAGNILYAKSLRRDIKTMASSVLSVSMLPPELFFSF